MRVHVNTSDFEFTHGRRPRGSGGWAFFFSRNDDVEKAFWYAGPYAEAKAAAVAEARRRGVDEVFVGT